MTSRVRLALVVGCLSFIGGTPAFSAQEPDGIALAVIQQTSIDSATGQRVLEAEAPIFTGDRIETGDSGEAQIRFRDNTKLVVGPNSSLVIDAFIFSGETTAQQVSINAVRGAFRFFTGASPKDAYSIHTPTATIGVRGTEFDVTVEREGTTRVANFSGVTIICPRGQVSAEGGGCVEADEPCTLSIIRPTESAIRYNNEDLEFRNRQLKYYFRYVRNQDSLLDDFQVDLAECRFSSTVERGGNNPLPPPVPPPPIVPPPMPGAPEAPVFSPPSLPPTIENRTHDRPVYEHTR